jgi:putative FmdB family regulatory protein
MPILNYKCHECGKEFAKILLNPDDAPRSCPVCGSLDPAEAGQAFSQDASSTERMMCTSCDSCGDTLCGIPSSS